MINLSNMKFDPNSLGKVFLLLSVSPFYVYENGAPTAEVGGFKYKVAVPDLGFEKLSVKIPGKKLLEMPPDKSHIQVEFDSLEYYVYWRDRQPQVSARAKGIRPVTDKS